MRLFIKLKNKPFCNDLHFFLIAVILFLLGLKYSVFYLFLLFYLLFIYKRFKFIFPILIVLGILCSRIAIDNFLTLPNKESYDCYIDEVEDNGYIIYTNGCKIKVIDDSSFEVGDVVNISFSFLDIEEKSYEEDFDYELYLKSKGIKYLAKANEVTYIKSSFSLKRIKYMISSYLEEKVSKESFSYISALILGDNTLESNIKDGYSILGISHILAISGLHILLLFKVLSFICLKVFHSYKATIPLSIISIYVAIIGFPSSCFRALLFLLLNTFNEKGKIRYTKLDILSISFIFMILLRPYQFYDIGFILSFLVSFILIFMNEFIHTSSKLKSNYFSFYIIYFITLPVVITYTNSISILALFLSPLIGNVVIWIILPISYFIFFIPQLDSILKYIFIFINQYILGLTEQAIIIPIGSLSIVKIFIYYILFFFLLVMLIKRKKRIKSLSVFLFYFIILINIKLITPYHKITFIDVGQGDSALIELAFNQGTMVIDAYNSFDYLKRMGISKIDYLILTHSDEDHIKDAKSIISYFNVKNIYYPYYDNGFMDYEGTKIKYKDSFFLGKYKVNVLAPIKEYEDKNSNSLVLHFNIDGFTFLFTGDMTIEEENDVIEVYNNKIQADVLKVGHHGSNTSTQEKFLELVQPKYSIISVKKDNSYHLPSEDVLYRLKQKSRVLTTMDCGNITFYIYNKMWLLPYR